MHRVLKNLFKNNHLQLTKKTENRTKTVTQSNTRLTTTVLEEIGAQIHTTDNSYETKKTMHAYSQEEMLFLIRTNDSNKFFGYHNDSRTHIIF